MSVATGALPMLLAVVEVVSVERLSPSFVRVELASPELAHLGVAGPWLDQRVKLVLPHAGRLPSVEGADETWLRRWSERPVEERGHMRTYTVREVRGLGEDTRLVVDVVVHEDDHAGPGARWAIAAAPGDRVVLLAPRRGVPFGGIEFDVSAAAGASLLLVGDETAVPAVAGILAGLPADATGEVFLEVPCAEDFQSLPAPIGVRVTWLARGTEAEVGSVLLPVVRRHLGLPAPVGGTAETVDPDLWETPAFSSSGEPIEADGSSEMTPLHAWVAGESGMVTTVRRALVRECGVGRRQVAFMGYWRRGVPMRS